ncbi:MAG: hypothetical protein ABIC68_08005 [Candidatus Omnitrophota bacterium]
MFHIDILYVTKTPDGIESEMDFSITQEALERHRRMEGLIELFDALTRKFKREIADMQQ